MLTQKQDLFCLKYIELGNASEAYRFAYNALNMKNETIHRKSSELVCMDKVSTKINELKAQHREKHNITVDDLLTELEEARQQAKESGNSTAMISATMGKAKILGIDKQVIEHQKLDDCTRPTIIEIVAPSMPMDITSN